MHQKLRLGMIGGGKGSFIGAVHRIASYLDGAYDLVCGAFSGDSARSRETGSLIGLDAARVYGSYAEMFEKETALPVAERMQVVSIVTPNHVHFEPAKMAMQQGFHVILDKPLTLSLSEALELRQIQETSGTLFCLTHTYTGYPMVKEARQVVASGKLGQIRKVYVEYPQGWLSKAVSEAENKQAGWRTDPARSGVAGCMGDIGTHAFNMAEYVSGLSVTKICADLNTVVAGRQLDDDGAVLLKFNNGASGVLFASQVAAGAENNIRIRVYGEEGSIDWMQEDANSLQVKWLNRPMETLRAGNQYLSSYGRHNCRTPWGHPEGYLEAFANLYRNFALTLTAKMAGMEPEPEWLDFPGMEEGIRGMAFIENVVAASASDQKWYDFKI